MRCSPRRDLAEWRTILDGVGVTFGIVATVNEALDDPQMRHAGALVPFADGQHLTVMTPFHIDGVDKDPGPARALGRPAQRSGAARGRLHRRRDRTPARPWRGGVIALVAVAVWVLTFAVAAGTCLALWHLRATDDGIAAAAGRRHRSRR